MNHLNLQIMKNSIYSILFFTMILCFIPFNTLFAQRDIKATLHRDIVKVENGTYSIGEYGLLSSFDKDYEVKITATA